MTKPKYLTLKRSELLKALKMAYELGVQDEVHDHTWGLAKPAGRTVADLYKEQVKKSDDRTGDAR